MRIVKDYYLGNLTKVKAYLQYKMLLFIGESYFFLKKKIFNIKIGELAIRRKKK
jgi:hypothetical protein